LAVNRSPSVKCHQWQHTAQRKQRNIELQVLTPTALFPSATCMQSARSWSRHI